MRVVTLLENETENDTLRNAHGLSLYIEANNKKILFDLGPNNHYITNAKKLKIDLADIDICVISHAHFDHGRGIAKFLKINKKAKVYVSEHAFTTKPFKVQNRIYIPIGIKEPFKKDRIVFIKDDIEISKGIILHSNIERVPIVIGDDSLLIKENGVYRPDPFEHEIYMTLKDDSNNVLISGCSHKGIDNIIDQLEMRTNSSFNTVIGGFHFSHYDSGNLKQSMYLQEVSEKFKDNNRKYYTGHCTGNDAYIEMKSIMKGNLIRFKTGTEFIL